MDYEHDDRRPGDVPGASGAEGSGLPAGDDLFDGMFLTGMRKPAFAAGDDDLGFPPPQGPDLASAFLAALDAIDDRRFVTPVPEEPPAAPPAPVPVQSALPPAAAPSEPVYELRPQSQLELESEAAAEPVAEASAEPVADAVDEGAARLPWDTARIPVAGLLTSGEFAGEPVSEPASEPASATEAISAAEDIESAEAAEAVEEFSTAASAEHPAPIEESAYYAAGLDGDAGDDDEAEAAAVIAAEADAEAEDVVAAAAQAEADAQEAAAAAEAEAQAEAEALTLALALAEAEAAAEAESDAAAKAAEAAAAAEQAELEAAIAAEAALALEEEAAASTAPPAFGAALDTFDTSLSASFAAALDESLDAPLEDAAFDMNLDGVALDETSAAAPEASAVPASPAATPFADAPFAADPITDEDDLTALVDDLAPGDDDFELEPSIGMEPMDVAPMAFDGPDAFAPAPVAAAAPEPELENESDELEDLQDYVVFSLGDMRCVVPIRNVVEVGRIPDAAPVPNAPVWLYGLGNLRGQVLSLIDLRAFFGVGRIKASAGRMVVLRGDSDDITAGVMVDQVHQIVALSPSRFKEAPAALPLPDKSTEFVWGACDYGNYTMIGLDVDGVLGVENLTEEAV